MRQSFFAEEQSPGRRAACRGMHSGLASPVGAISLTLEKHRDHDGGIPGAHALPSPAPPALPCTARKGRCAPRTNVHRTCPDGRCQETHAVPEQSEWGCGASAGDWSGMGDPVELGERFFA
jgi:hypothetical protein